MPGERGYEIILGPGRMAQDRLKSFAEAEGYDAEINSPELGKVVVYLRSDSGELFKDEAHYQKFLNQFLLLDDRFSPYTDGQDTRMTIHVTSGRFGPCIEAYYL
jgi:hypothetical protein